MVSTTGRQFEQHKNSKAPLATLEGCVHCSLHPTRHVCDSEQYSDFAIRGAKSCLMLLQSSTLVEFASLSNCSQRSSEGSRMEEDIILTILQHAIL